MTKAIETSDVAKTEAPEPVLVLLECPRVGSSRKLRAYAEACRADSIKRGESPLVPALHGGELAAWAAQADKVVLYVDKGVCDETRATVAMLHGIEGVTIENRILEVMPDEAK